MTFEDGWNDLEYGVRRLVRICDHFGQEGLDEPILEPKELWPDVLKDAYRSGVGDVIYAHLKKMGEDLPNRSEFERIVYCESELEVVQGYLIASLEENLEMLRDYGGAYIGHITAVEERDVGRPRFRGFQSSLDFCEWDLEGIRSFWKSKQRKESV